MSAAIGTGVGASLRTRDTVDCETPAARAMSCIVTARSRAVGRGGLSSLAVTARPLSMLFSSRNADACMRLTAEVRVQHFAAHRARGRELASDAS